MRMDVRAIVTKLLLHPAHNSYVTGPTPSGREDSPSTRRSRLQAYQSAAQSKPAGATSSAGTSDAPLETGGGRPRAELTEEEVVYLVMESRKLFMSQPMLIEVEAPIQLCGDVHGQYSDLLRLFTLGGFPPESNYMFLGDYVDRGEQSLETICLLFSYKLLFPDNFFLLRGNHECSSINRIYGFFDECKRRFSVKLWKLFTDTFNCMPVVGLVDQRILCMHGGLSPELNNLDQLRRILRPTDVPDSGLICDLLWSDPGEADLTGWGENDRGVSWTFGPDVVETVTKHLDIDMICRAHQVVDEGYQFFAQRRLLTVFSAPNYCGEFNNAGAFVCVDPHLVCSIVQIRPTNTISTYY